MIVIDSIVRVVMMMVDINILLFNFIIFLVNGFFDSDWCVFFFLCFVN